MTEVQSPPTGTVRHPELLRYHDEFPLLATAFSSTERISTYSCPLLTCDVDTQVESDTLPSNGRSAWSFQLDYRPDPPSVSPPPSSPRPPRAS